MKHHKSKLNIPIYNTNILEYNVICTHCGKKEVLKTKIKGCKIYNKVCRRCGQTYKIDITSLSPKGLDKFMYWIETNTK